MHSLDARWLREGARDDAEFQAFLQRRAAGEPVHRILGWREFWGLRFFLSSETLEPRPDSELFIELLLSPARFAPGERNFLDLGTGTGCLLLAALHEFPNATGIGIDQSADAIATAQKNAEYHHLNSRAEFRQMDWHDETTMRALGRFDVILCNPPYIPTHDIAALAIDVKNYDPLTALDGGTDGLAPYRIIAAQLKYLLKPDGIALFEFGYDQSAQVIDIMQSHGLSPSSAYKDLGGNDRVIIVGLG